MSLIWAIIVEHDTNVSEGVINQISFHLTHGSGVKILGNFSVSEILISVIIKRYRMNANYVDDDHISAHLIPWGLNKMAAILHTTLSRKKAFGFWVKFHYILFIRIQVPW